MSEELSPAEEVIVTLAVTRRLASVTQAVTRRMEGARGGLHHLSPRQFKNYTDVLRALDALRESLT
jgi:hypothetical protein